MKEVLFSLIRERGGEGGIGERKRDRQTDRAQRESDRRIHLC